ncbi:MAG TPA: hypothetical protein VGP24_09120 [Glaciihabitans sp.]|jgi:hypothetical protein|nr:hypothetical protein [Glaciihabitans sp.]
MTEQAGDRDERLREALSGVLDSVDPSLAARLEHDPSAYLDLIELTNQGTEEMLRLLHSSVQSARAAGVSWGRIGERLGMSRQAAQQRFGSPAEAAALGATTEIRRLSPVTAFDEMEELAAAGREGWHSVGFGPYYHDLALSAEQWEHLRVPAFGPTRRQLKEEGWQQIGTMWFPWAYFARPTGKPVEQVKSVR